MPSPLPGVTIFFAHRGQPVYSKIVVRFSLAPVGASCRFEKPINHIGWLRWSPFKNLNTLLYKQDAPTEQNFIDILQRRYRSQPIFFINLPMVLVFEL